MMKFLQSLVDGLLAPRIISNNSPQKQDKRQAFIERILLPMIFPGYKRPEIRLQKIDVSSSRRNVKK